MLCACDHMTESAKLPWQDAIAVCAGSSSAVQDNLVLEHYRVRRFLAHFTGMKIY